MTSRKRNLFVIALVLALLATSALIISTKPTVLGLDLKGGVELVYQGQATADSEVTPEAIDRSIEVIRDRIDQLGVSEPEIQRIGDDQISVGLPGQKDLERAKRIVGTTAQLYMYDFADSVIPEEVSPGDNSSTREQTTPYRTQYEAVREAHKQKPVADKDNTTACSTPDTPEKCKQYYLFGKRVNGTRERLAGPDSSKKDLLSEFDGKQPRGSVIETVPLGTIVVQADQGGHQGNTTADPGYYVLKDNPAIRGTQIDDPQQQTDSGGGHGGGGSGNPNVTFDFKNGGAEAFREFTQTLVQRAQTDQIPGQQIVPQSFAVVLDGVIQSKPVVDPEDNPNGIDGRLGAQITGNFTLTEAQDLANTLATGALPVRLKLISTVQISASLGQQALDQGLLALIVGLLLVVAFLLTFYRILGVIAVLALAVYAVFFFALIRAIPITLTLPGIAGLILTIGVAADANIVIFERIKEELRAGKPAVGAIATGFSRGIRTIIDANVAILITAFILFVLATAGVKGFAFTLLIGTIVSFMTAVVFTQAILGMLGRSKLFRRPSVLGAGPRRFHWRFDYMGKSKLFFATSGVILVICSAALAIKGINFGIDFQSGTRVTAALSDPVDTEKVRATLDKLGVPDAKIQTIDNKDLGENVVQISTEDLGPGDVKRVQSAFDRDFDVNSEGFSSQSVGPTFGKTVAQSAIYAVIFSLLLIMGYIALRFSGKYAVPVVIALAHDILITTGVYALVGQQVTTATVAAMLTILGYSLYDTVIVFDRIRENRPRMPRSAFSQIVNRSMSEVLTRSLATSFSTLLPVMALLVFGGETLQDFAFALAIGILSGAYSSIFIASPLLTESFEREPAFVQRRRRIVSELGHVPAYAAPLVAGVEDVAVDRAEEIEEDLEQLEADAQMEDRAKRPEPERVADVTESDEVEAEMPSSSSSTTPVARTPKPPRTRKRSRAQRKRGNG